MNEPDAHDEQESEKERTQRQLMELLQELRVVTAGVQVLFAFLLTIPFSQRFADVNEFQKTVYFATLLLTTLSAAMLMAPTAYHRLRFHQRDRQHIVEVSNRFALAGLVALALAMTGAVLLVSDFLYSSTTLIVAAAGGTGLVFAVCWYVLPLLRRLQDR
jgi:amino acid transporter